MDDTPEVLRDSLWRTLQAVSDWIRVADAKAGAALAVDGVMLALTSARLRASTPPTVVTVIGLSMAITLAAASGLIAIWAVIPRTRRLKAHSMVHYGTIGSFESADDYHIAAISGFTDPEELTKTLTRHIWTISKSAIHKYRLVILAIQLLVAAMVVGLLALLTS